MICPSKTTILILPTNTITKSSSEVSIKVILMCDSVDYQILDFGYKIDAGRETIADLIAKKVL